MVMERFQSSIKAQAEAAEWLLKRAYESGSKAKHNGWSDVSPFCTEQETVMFRAAYGGETFEHAVSRVVNVGV